MYAELHCHSAFSFLDGASLPEDLAATAHELGYSALALTDHNGLYGSMAFAQAAKPLGLQAITGAELTLLDGSHVTLLAETPEDRKSTRLNSSHMSISYAVFCLKKKKK